MPNNGPKEKNPLSPGVNPHVTPDGRYFLLHDPHFDSIIRILLETDPEDAAGRSEELREMALLQRSVDIAPGKKRPPGQTDLRKSLKRDETRAAREERRDRSEDGDSIVTVDNAIDMVLAGIIPAEWTYIRPRGAADFQDVIEKYGAYYVPWVEYDIIKNTKHNKIRTHNRPLCILGGGKGQKEILQSSLNGWPSSIKNVDLSQDYAEMLAEEMYTAGFRKRIVSIHEDFFTNLVRKDVWENNIRAANDNTAATFSMYGGTAGNPPWPIVVNFFEAFASRMLPGNYEKGGYNGDILYVGFDSTINEALLKSAYSGELWEKMFIGNLKFVYERLLGLTGIDETKISFRTEVKQEEGHSTVYVYMDVAKDHPKLEIARPSEHARLKSLQDRLANSFAGSVFESLRSRRTPEKMLREVFKMCDLKILKKLSLPKNNHWRKSGVNYNVWALGRPKPRNRNAAPARLTT